MRYFPILQELFESDTIVFFLLGLIVTLPTVLQRRSVKKALVGAIAALIVYALCEIVSNFAYGSYMLAFIALFVGTVAIGSFAGFLVGLIAAKRKGNK